MIAAAAIAGFIIGGALMLLYFAWRLDVYERRLMRAWNERARMDIRIFDAPNVDTRSLHQQMREAEEALARSERTEVIPEYDGAEQNPGGRDESGVLSYSRNQSAEIGIDPSVTEEERPAPPPHLRLLPGVRPIRRP